MVHVDQGSSRTALGARLWRGYLGVGLAAALLAEGIEEQEQRRALVDLGCRLGQGYLTGFPADARVVARLIAEQEAGNPAAKGRPSTAPTAAPG